MVTYANYSRTENTAGFILSYKPQPATVGKQNIAYGKHFPLSLTNCAGTKEQLSTCLVVKVF